MIFPSLVFYWLKWLLTNVRKTWWRRKKNILGCTFLLLVMGQRGEWWGLLDSQAKGNNEGLLVTQEAGEREQGERKGDSLGSVLLMKTKPEIAPLQISTCVIFKCFKCPGTIMSFPLWNPKEVCCFVFFLNLKNWISCSVQEILRPSADLRMISWGHLRN